MFGTVSYIAPEQARADNPHLDARSNMWSIAATMFRALTGETVHPSTGPIIVRLLAVARKPPRSIATVLPRLPRPVIELVDRALAFEPEDRWPSANVMRVVVQDVMAQCARRPARTSPDRGPAAAAPPRHHPAADARAHRTRAARGAPGRTPATARSAATQDRSDRAVEWSADPATERSLARGRAGPRRHALRERPEEARQRRSRTLLTREGRAELRRILDARKAAQASEEPVTNVAIPAPKLAPAVLAAPPTRARATSTSTSTTQSSR